MKSNFPIEEYGQAYRFVLDYKKQEPFTSNDDFAKMLLNFVKSFAASLPQSSTEEEDALIWSAVISGIRRYENETDFDSRKGILNELRSYYKISKR